MFDQVSIIGCGLIGSSILRRLKKNNSVKKLVSYDNNCEILKKAQNIQKEYISKNFSIENSAYRLENFYSNTFNV